MFFESNFLKKFLTETGSAIAATCLGNSQNLYVPNFTTGLPFVGYDIKIMESEGKSMKEIGHNQLGRIVVKLPLPPGNMSTLYKNDDMFEKVYFRRFPGYYDTMDAGYKDENGYIYVTARDDASFDKFLRDSIFSKQFFF